MGLPLQRCWVQAKVGGTDYCTVVPRLSAPPVSDRL